MWRPAYALVSAFVLTMTFVTAALAANHPTTPATTGGGTTTTVTAVPNTGSGIMPDHVPSALVLGLFAVAALLALMALTTWRRQEA